MTTPSRRADVHVVLPNDIDDPATPSGGNVYDRRSADGAGRRRLDGAGARRARRLAAARPRRAGRAGRRAGGAARRRGGAARRAGRLGRAGGAGAGRPAGCGWWCWCTCRWATTDARSASGACAAAAARWSPPARGPGGGCSTGYGLPADRVHVATPGVDPAPLAPGIGGRHAAALRRRGHPAQGPRRAASAALATVADLPWSCACVGSLDRDPDFVGRLRRGTRRARPRRPGRAWSGRAPGPSWPPRTPRPTCWCCLARGDVRHGGDRGAGPRAPGAGDGGRRAARGARARPGRQPAGPAGRRRTTRRRWPPRCAAGSATPTCAAGCAARPGAAGHARRLGGHRARGSRAGADRATEQARAVHSQEDSDDHAQPRRCRGPRPAAAP